jgi:cation:H+ antiporter
MQYYLLLIAGFTILLYSGNYLVKGSVSLAQKYKVSKLVMGVTVVSFGTSAPELFVSVTAAIEKQSEISVGNIVGSNIANIALVLALTAIIFPIPVRRNAIRFDWPVMMLASLLFYLFILNGFLRFWEGLTFFVLLNAYVFVSIYYSRKNYDYENEKKIQAHFSLALAILIILISVIGLAAGSYLLVDNAAKIAGKLGIEKRVISISVIAFGTSVPELATSMIAAFRKEMDISIGNIIGSNIFNILGVLGIASIITPISIVEEMRLKIDILWMLGISIILFLFMLPFKGGKLTRLKGIILFAVYCFYIYWLFIKIPGK